jgi:putative oxygen-independent coproporphyrinogen III oxidase
MNIATHEPFGVYVHWPFCQSKCPYCDFNSHVRERVDHARWGRALEAELDHTAGLTGPRRVDTVFFGGGTPSLMQPETVATVLDAVAGHWTLAPEAEITLEANPSSVEAGRLAAFRAAGVNRVSLGVQSFDDVALSFLGRRHSAAEAHRAIDLARGLFQRVSFDLIYARPEQEAAAWRRELATALDKGPRHLSVYQLTIEPGTAFHGLAARGAFAMPAEDDAAGLFELTQEVLASAGLPAYEISNHAAPGEACRHNLLYWRCQDTVGVGPGAHGRFTAADGSRRATRQHRAPEAWLERVERAGHATRADEPVGAEEQMRELLLMGLRLAKGVPRARLRRIDGRDLEDWIAPTRLGPLVEAGLIAVDAATIRATAAGRQRLNAVLGYLLA